MEWIKRGGSEYLWLSTGLEAMLEDLTGLWTQWLMLAIVGWVPFSICEAMCHGHFVFLQTLHYADILHIAHSTI